MNPLNLICGLNRDLVVILPHDFKSVIYSYYGGDSLFFIPNL